MLVQPAPVRTHRGRWAAAAWIVALAAVLFPALLAAMNSQTGVAGATPGALSVAESNTAAVTTGPVQAPYLSVQLVSGTTSPGAEAVLGLTGWIPSQFSWASIDVVVGDRRVNGLGMRVDQNGAFSGVLRLMAPAPGEQLVVRLSGLNDVQLAPVPLLTTQLSALDPSRTRSACLLMGC